MAEYRNLHVSLNLHKRLKIVSVMTGVKMSDLTEDGMEEFVSKMESYIKEREGKKEPTDKNIQVYKRLEEQKRRYVSNIQV